VYVSARYRWSVTEAKHDTKAVPDPETPDAASAGQSPDSAPEASGQPGPSAPAEDDVRRRFREALERKNASPGTHPGSQADGGNQMKSSNGKRKREFRRKSGG
jgi:hypothetical protein